uniref:Uncharacterized protein n=1 Tax=viral metagenome TaxID=1070528 RepID=A0A6C0EKE0_9ZZZZ
MSNGKKKQTKGLKRNVIDKYYTKTEVVDLCIETIKNKINIDNEHLIIEPSAGNGAFIDGIKTLCDNYKFYDKEPEHDDIDKQDYLELEFEAFEKYEKKHIIGNPPFGRQSSLAIKFIKHSCKFCNTISFILPKSFKKDSLKKHFPLHFHLIEEKDLPTNSFLVNDIEYDVPCVFQIWEKKEEKRIVSDKLVPIGYSFKTMKEDENLICDISFRRVGINAGVVDTNISGKSKQSHYFIKFDNIDDFDTNQKEEFIKKFKNIKFSSSENTVGPKSISKQELIREFNKITSQNNH